jgi:hypothetical protein
MEADEHKGYRIEYITSDVPAAPPYSPARFHISRTRGERRELLHTGEVQGTFSSPGHAFRAACDAARIWIYEHAGKSG